MSINRASRPESNNRALFDPKSSANDGGRVRPAHKSRLAASRLTSAALLLTLLTACSTMPSQSAIKTTLSPPVEAGKAENIAPLDCSIVAPISGAAGILGLPIDEVAELPPFTGSSPTHPGIVSVAMSMEAMHEAGQTDCRYGLVGRATNGPEVSISVLPNAADDYIQGQPALIDGTQELKPSDISNRASLGCQPGEQGGSWFESPLELCSSGIALPA